jgi:hypothetical protein
LGYVKTRNHAQQIGNIQRAGAAYVLP